jgi:hypothetical protein
VVIDLKVGKLTHGDLGQMQLYVNYYDREVVTRDDNPTIGLVLCSEKNDAVVRYVLADKSEQIFASRYQFALPSEADLRAEIRRELEQFGHALPAASEVPAAGQPDVPVARKKATTTKTSKSRAKPASAKGKQA